LIKDHQPGSPVLAGGTHVTFSASGSDPDGDPLTYTWDFGDGTTDQGATLFHTFYDEGQFKVTLTVSDGRGGTATDSVFLTARKIAGNWDVQNALHAVESATISQGSSSSGFSGTTSDGSRFSGNLGDPFSITLNYSAGSALCIPSGTYHGTVDISINKITFPGANCKNFTLVRQ
jgi:PKD repeat protein